MTQGVGLTVLLGVEGGPSYPVYLHVSLSFWLSITLGFSISLCLSLSLSFSLSAPHASLSRFFMSRDGLAHTPRVQQDRGHHQFWKLQALGIGLPDKIQNA